MTKIKIITNTVLKAQPVESTQLSDDKKEAVKTGNFFDVKSYTPTDNHIKVIFPDKSVKNSDTWYVFQKHAVVVNDDKIVYPDQIKLPVPYLCQLDNTEDPYGTCNITSMSMVLNYFGIKGQNNDSERLPDELHDWIDARGLDRHDPACLAQVVDAYGVHDNFRQDATIEDVQEWLTQGNPAVVHGYFTSSGHIVCLIGYNSYGFIVNDPYGEYFAEGYDTSSTGAGLSYSYELIKKTCMTDNQFWVHFLSKK